MPHLNRCGTVLVLALASLLALGAACSPSQPGSTGGAGGSTNGSGGSTNGTGGSATGTGGSTTGTGGATGGAVGTGGAAGGSPGSGGAGQVGGAGGAGGAGNSAGATGSGGSAGGSAATCKYKLCEDFESSTVGSVPAGWTSFQGYNGTIGATDQAVASDAAHSGSKSLKSIAASQGTSRVQKALSNLGATANTHWGRIFYKVQSPSAVDNANVLHTTFVSLMGGSTEDRVVDTVETEAAHTHQWLFNTPDDACCTSSTYDWTFDDGWHCAEWYVDLTTKSYRFFSDGTEVTQIAFSNRSNAEMPASYAEIILGATYYQHDTLSGPFTIWIDDLAIDDNQIGCQ
jgi:hypothetical protein